MPLIRTRVFRAPWPRLSGIRECPAGQRIATVDDGDVWALVGQNGHLFQRLLQGVAVVGVARKAAHADHEALVQRGGDADIAAELVADAGFAFRDAIHLGFMQGVDLVRTLGLLVQQVRHKGELGDDAIPQAALGDILQMAAQVAHDPAGIAFQLFQRLAHALELLGMGIAAHLQRQSRCKARVGLPQLHPGLLRQRHQLIARPLVKPGVRGMGNRLLHHGGIDRHTLDAVVVDGTGLLPSLDRLGQQRLCCTNPVRDSSRESSVVAGWHEQTYTPRLQDPELARLQRSTQAPRVADDLVRSRHDLGGCADWQTWPTARLQ